MKSLEIINTLIDSLPRKDIILGHKFLDIRDFDSLKELIDSTIIKIKRNMRSNNPKEEYLSINLDDLINLKSEVDSYRTNIEPIETEYY